MPEKSYALAANAQPSEIVDPQQARRAPNTVNVEFEFEDTLGAAMLGVVAISLLISLLLVIRQNRALVTQLRREV